MRNTILSLLVACGLLLVGPVADVKAQGQGQGVDGECQSIVAEILGHINQVVVQGFDAATCFGIIGPAFGEFSALGCEAPGKSVGTVIGENGKSCNINATICDALFICFDGLVPDGCVDVDICAIP